MGKFYTSVGRYIPNKTLEYVQALVRDCITGAMAVTRFQSALYPGVEHYREAHKALESLRYHTQPDTRNYPLEDALINKLETYLYEDTIRSQAADAVRWQQVVRDALEAWSDLDDARDDNRRCEDCGLIGGH